MDGSLPHTLSFEEVQNFFETSLDLIVLADRQGCIQYLNPAWEKNLGWMRAEMMGRAFFDFIHPDDKERSVEAFATVFRGQELSYFENRYRDRNGTYHTLLWTVPAVPSGSSLSYACARDRTEQKKMHDLLRESEERYRLVVESSGQLIYDYDVASGHIIWSGAITRITGYSPEEFRQMNFDQWVKNLHPDDREQAVALLEEAIHNNTQYSFRYRFRHKSGHYLYIADTGLFLFDKHNHTHRMLGSMSDITAMVTYEQSLQESEAHLRSSLHDKELLLREIHHRVKNNLQIISSLLNLQASQLDDRAKILFRESRDRIRTMALIHEQLYTTYDVATIRVADYMKQLATNLSRSYGSDNIALELQIDPDMYLELDIAVPCGLITNELISNAMKYAFAGKASGKITVGFTSDDTHCSLVVSDNGCGLPDAVTPTTARTLGLQLVDTLVHQIGATMNIDRTNGTTFTITRHKV